MAKACVIGWPITHSRSPLIHGYWLRQHGIDGSYEKVAVRPEDAASFLRALAANGYSGCNVTVPLKEIALATANWRDPSAVAVGAANTIWLDDGKICAANTDTYGYIANLDMTVAEWRSLDAPVAVLGAGGTARAVVHGFLSAGVDEVRIVARNTVHAEIVARHFGPKVKVYPWIEINSAAGASGLIVNTTTLGMNGVGCPDVDFSMCVKQPIVSDVVYVPLETAFLASARKAGLRTVDGLGMLLHQAVPGFEKWFGVRPEVTHELRAMIMRDIESVA